MRVRRNGNEDAHPASDGVVWERMMLAVSAVPDALSSPPCGLHHEREEGGGRLEHAIRTSRNPFD